MIETLFLAIGIALTPISNTIIEDNEIEQPEEPIIMPDFDESSSFSDAISININNALIGTFSDSSDIDYYSFTAFENIYYLYTNGYSNVNVSLYDSSFHIIQTICSVSSSNKQLIPTLTINEVYYLAVSSATIDYSRRYSISFSTLNILNPEIENNFIVHGEAVSTDDYFFYSFTPSQSYVYNVMLSATNNACYSFSYFESNNTIHPIHIFNSFTNDDEFNFIYLRQNTTYYIVIECISLQSYSSFNFSLVLPNTEILKKLIFNVDISNVDNINDSYYSYSLDYILSEELTSYTTDFYNPYPEETTSFGRLICNGDDRKKIENTKTYPFNSIGLNMIDNDGHFDFQDGGGSGYAIANNAYITAAHVLTEFTLDNPDGFAKHRQFAPGINSLATNISSTSFGVFKVLHYYIPAIYFFAKHNRLNSTDSEFNYDWGICVFDIENPIVTPIYQHGYFSIRYIVNRANCPNGLFSSGYPGVMNESSNDRTFYQWTNINSNGYQKSSTVANFVSSNQIYVNLNVSNGNSGQPLYSFNEGTGEATSYGTVVSGSGSNMYSSMITRECFEIVQSLRVNNYEI